MKIRLALVFAAWMGMNAVVVAQSYSAPEPVPAEFVRPEQLTEINPARVALRVVGQDWQLWHGKLALKDFGSSYAEATEALATIRELNLNAFGVVGTGDASMDYWLSDGRAPLPGSGRRTVRNFDPETLQVKSFSGVYCLCDERSLLFRFGRSEEDARQALAVCKKYGFNQIVYIGQPTPTMTYLVHDASVLNRDPSMQPRPSQNLLQQFAEATRGALLIPEVGYVGQRTPVQPGRMEVRYERGTYHLKQGTELIASFGRSYRDAQDALNFFRDARITEVCQVGRLTFFMSNGQVRRGVPLGINKVPFDPRNLSVQEVGGSWAILEGQRPLLVFGDDSTEAELALKVIQHYQFDRLCRLGRSATEGINFLARGR